MKRKFDAYVLWPLAKKFQNRIVDRTEVRFASFLSGEFITAIAANPPERKLAKRISVHRFKSAILEKLKIAWFNLSQAGSVFSTQNVFSKKNGPIELHKTTFSAKAQTTNEVHLISYR